MAKNEEELKSLLMRVKEKSKKAGLKFNVHKTKIMASGPITSQQIEGGKVEIVTDFIFWAYRAKTTQWAPRDTCRGSRREWSPLLPLEMRPDSPGEYGMQPQIPVAYGEEH